jgi:hypothetical protein
MPLSSSFVLRWTSDSVTPLVQRFLLFMVTQEGALHLKGAVDAVAKELAALRVVGTAMQGAGCLFVPCGAGMPAAAVSFERSMEQLSQRVARATSGVCEGTCLCLGVQCLCVCFLFLGACACVVVVVVVVVVVEVFGVRW